MIKSIIILSVFISMPLYAGNLPDRRLTPGDILDVSIETLCVPGYTKTVRNVPESEKRAVYAEYGIKLYKGIGKDYEVDHLISLELGGSNDIKNLWPEAYFPVDRDEFGGKGNPLPGARQKDLVENFLHRQVCEGKITLKAAQYSIANDWTEIYNDIKK